MQAGERVGIFLKRKLEENKLKRMDLSRESGISNATIYNTYNNKQDNVSFKTVLTLANYFNCSLDEIFERDAFKDIENKTYHKITPEEAMNKIKNFMINKFEESDKNIPKFSESCGLEGGSIRGFITRDSRHQNIYCNNILAIADHFNISLDDLIGRSNNQNKTIFNNKVNATETTAKNDEPKDISQKLTSKEASKLEEIKQSYEEFQNEIKQKVNAINGVKSKVKDNSQSR